MSGHFNIPLDKLIFEVKLDLFQFLFFDIDRC